LRGDVVPNRITVPHVMSRGHSEPFELGVHWRTQLPPLPSAGTLAHVVSAKPGWSGHSDVQAIEQIPGAVAVAPRHSVPVWQSEEERQ
jgi:hypothetical protein